MLYNQSHYCVSKLVEIKINNISVVGFSKLNFKVKSSNEFTIEAISRIQSWCNILPRKILGYLTPDEAFEDQLREIFYE